MTKTLLISILTFVMIFSVACATAIALPTDPASVVKAFYEAENTKNLEAAMALIADDAVFSFPVYGEQKGKDKIREWEQFAMRSGGEFELSNLQVVGDKVTFTAKFLWNGSRLQHDYEVIVQRGKIKSLTAK